MFAVIYSFKVKEGKEAQFKESWSGLTKLIYEFEGSYGSRLHRKSDTEFLAYALWPNRQTWEESGEKLPEAANEHRTNMRDACFSIETIEELEVEEDLLKEAPFSF
jgi:heme-degrading monooxygenase HmoA